MINGQSIGTDGNLGRAVSPLFCETISGDRNRQRGWLDQEPMRGWRLSVLVLLLSLASWAIVIGAVWLVW